MKKIVFLLVALSSSAIAQRITMLSGDLQELKGQTSFKIRFQYSNMVVGTETKEKEYLAKKSSEWDLKEPGKGDSFVRFWFDSRKELYEPKFIQNFEKYGKVKLNNDTAEYTLIVKTKRTEGGWTIGVLNNPGEIDGEVWIVESIDHSKVIATIGFSKMTGKYSHGGDFEMTIRIQSAYEIAGKALGDYLRRKAK